jgi:hypothetical protein
MTRLIALALAGLAFAAQAQDTAPEEMEVIDPGEGYTPPETSATEVLRLTGYVDIGFAKAFGDGTSFSPQDTRVPQDYGVDTFAPMVNSRGEVASTNSGGRFLNGFLPRSVGIGGKPSFLLNTLSADVRFQPRGLPLFFFARVQVMPRFSGAGDATRLELQQAFGRWSPFSAHELAISLGRFDSVFGIEYLENEANLRVNITPSLIARYTTGQSLGAKAFYRRQLPALQSALSVNLALTNSGTRIEALVPTSLSLTGVPVASGRLGYELNLQHLQVKLGVSGLYGPRADQRAVTSRQMAIAGDVRISAFGVSLAGEFLRLIDERGRFEGKATGQPTTAELASAFDVWGGWARLAYTLPFTTEALTGVTLYGRYERRHARFEGYTPIATDRITVGARVDLYEVLALKAEVLLNREHVGAPSVDNDVVTASAVFTW